MAWNNFDFFREQMMQQQMRSGLWGGLSGLSTTGSFLNPMFLGAGKETKPMAEKDVTVEKIMKHEPCPEWSEARVRDHIGDGMSFEEFLDYKHDGLNSRDKMWVFEHLLPKFSWPQIGYGAVNHCECTSCKEQRVKVRDWLQSLAPLTCIYCGVELNKLPATHRCSNGPGKSFCTACRNDRETTEVRDRKIAATNLVRELQKKVDTLEKERDSHYEATVRLTAERDDARARTADPFNGTKAVEELRDLFKSNDTIEGTWDYVTHLPSWAVKEIKALRQELSYLKGPIDERLRDMYRKAAASDISVSTFAANRIEGLEEELEEWNKKGLSPVCWQERRNAILRLCDCVTTELVDKHLYAEDAAVEEIEALREKVEDLEPKKYSEEYGLKKIREHVKGIPAFNDDGRFSLLSERVCAGIDALVKQVDAVKKAVSEELPF